MFRSEPELSNLLDETAKQLMEAKSAEATSPITQASAEELCASTSKPHLQDENKGLSNNSPQARHTGVHCELGTHVGQNYSSTWEICAEMPPEPYQELQLGKTYHSLSFHESSVSRYIHRYCLEYTFQLFMNPAANPQDFYRVFRLVPCIADKNKMQPYFKNLISRGSDESLEIPGLPFYNIGGAGTHFTRKDNSGDPIFPSNTRLPKRILGLPHLLGTDPSEQEKKYAEFLEMRGYGGIWFDSYEVERYLMEKGISLNSFSPLHGTGKDIEYTESIISPNSMSGNTTFSNISTSTTSSQFGTNGEETMEHSFGENSRSHICDEEFDAFISSNPSSFFDVQRFLDYLTQHVAILGRAPGFKKSTVDAAIDYAMCSGSPL